MIDKILITGNGFDLYHNLPTRYSDFLFFCKNWNVFIEEYKKKNFTSVESNRKDRKTIEVRLSDKGELIKESLIDFAHYDIYDSKHIGFLYDNISHNGWIDYFFKISFAGENWIDFEAEIQNALEIVDEYYNDYLCKCIGTTPIINMRDSMKLVINSFSSYANNDYKDLSKNNFSDRDNDPVKLRQNKKLLLMSMYDELNKLRLCLEYYLSDFVTPINCKYYSSQIKELGNNIFLLNFNYTYTFTSVYGKGEEYYHHPIHGEAKENNTVLGVSDESFNGTTDFLYFQKFFQRIQKKTGNYYKEFVKPLKYRSINDKPFDVFIIGHSLDKVDKGILQDFFYNDDRIRTIKIFYYNQKAYENIVINLIDMFGKDFVIEQTGNERIVFEELKDRILLD